MLWKYPSRVREKMDEYYLPKVRTHLFGIVNEGAGTEHNYLIHKPGKSNPNAVISMLHDFQNISIQS